MELTKDEFKSFQALLLEESGLFFSEDLLNLKQ
jgi:hypothetical protein